MSLKNKLTADESQFGPKNYRALSHEISLRLNISTHKIVLWDILIIESEV